MKTSLISVMIVEDEYLVRLGMSTLIPWEQHGMKLVGEAADGFEALAVFDQVRPQIVITDIKMPGLDGMELIKQLKQKDPSVSIVIVSSYESFEYARTALRYDTSDYLLKSGMKPDELLGCLQKIIHKQGLQGVADDPKQSESGIVNRTSVFLTRSLKEASKVSGLLKIRRTEIGSCLLVRRITDTDGDVHRQKLFQRTAINMVLEVFGSTAIVEQIDPERFLVMYSANRDDRISPVERFLRLLNQYMEMHSYLYLSSSWVDAEQLLQSLDECENNIDQAFICGVNRISVAPVLTGMSSMYVEPFRATAVTIACSLLARKPLELQQQIDGWFTVCVDSRIAIQKFSSVFGELCLLLNRFLAISALIRNEKPPEEIISRISDYMQLEDLKNNLNMSLLDLVSEWKPVAESDIVDRVLSIVASSFREDISLDDLSDTLSVSSSYISSKFKKTLGIPFVSFLNALRIGHASIWMELDSTKRVYEIASDAGFSDAAYFSRKFKEIMQHCPSRS